MSVTTSIDELRSMQSSDLLRERKVIQAEVAGMRMGLQLKKEKDSARYRRERRALARIETVLSEKKQPSKSSKNAQKSLQKPKNSSTLRRP